MVNVGNALGEMPWVETEMNVLPFVLRGYGNL